MMKADGSTVFFSFQKNEFPYTILSFMVFSCVSVCSIRGCISLFLLFWIGEEEVVAFKGEGI